MSRRNVEEATAESGDGYSITVKGLTEDKALGEPCMANRGALDLVVTGPYGLLITQWLARITDREAQAQEPYDLGLSGWNPS